MTFETSYDVLPYFSAPFQATHPDRLAVVATLFGLKPVSAERCRVLELGCAAGGNLIPLAVALPQSRFVGIDQSARQVAEGQQIVRELSLKNIELHATDILDVDDNYGMFDYIICHGVYSWVPEPVQNKILAICARLLQADGVGYISYNTLPGWHMQGMIRDMMCYHIGRSPGGSPASQVGQARALLNFLARSVREEKSPYGLLLERTLGRLQGLSDSYLFHEYLEDCNELLPRVLPAARGQEASLPRRSARQRDGALSLSTASPPGTGLASDGPGANGAIPGFLDEPDLSAQPRVPLASPAVLRAATGAAGGLSDRVLLEAKVSHGQSVVGWQ
jgi:SAM-dependent methyltransferase